MARWTVSAVSAVASAAALVGGCAPWQSVRTEVRVADASAVALTRGDGSVLVPAGAGPSEDALVARGRAPLGLDPSAAYEVRARREPDGRLTLGWTTGLPRVDDRRYTVLPPSGPIELDGSADEVTPSMHLGDDVTTFRWCAGLRVRFHRRVSTYAVEPRDCATTLETGYAPPPRDVVRVPYRLETKTSNVRIVQHTRTQHDVAWVSVGVGALLASAAATEAALGPARWGGARTEAGVVSISAAFAALFVAVALPTLFAKDEDVVIRP